MCVLQEKARVQRSHIPMTVPLIKKAIAIGFKVLFSLQATEWLEFSVLLRYSFLQSKCFRTIVCKLAWAAFINHIWGQGNANVHNGVIYNKEKERLFSFTIPFLNGFKVQTFFFIFYLFYLSKKKITVVLLRLGRGIDFPANNICE